MLKYIFLSIMVLNLSGAATAAQGETRVEAPALRVAQLNRKSGLSIIDVRAPGDFAKGHIQGAINVPSAEVQRAGLDRAGTIVVYCGEDPCPLTSGAYQRLSSDGYRDVSILAGGLPAWMAKGYPVVAGGSGNALPRKGGAGGSAEQAQAKLQAGMAIAVDTRPADEYRAGHLPGAINSPLETLQADAVRLPKDKEIVVYDRQAGRAQSAVSTLVAAGLRATALPGGLAGWAKRGMPLEVK